ncbi:cytochrome c(L), periplasmic [Methylobacterium mesophilicum SR1.6/6]|uniref:Cytochrome c-L n=1 Tax=Methylobacterium mesophilicum SR1.6/6 TaxID=908290 RepID=A0A6B9F978_9HYPH|nr:cytochrome c(L), periplasmic [Methylobacterium mesophilicum]MBE7244447.1 cytochrome c(L), periplasmic [Actinomycetospora chiangmaiensis]QGY00621.1 cytochrome c(L), periplasmic [Methylobacterium mesophilicum SR1.6/6]
MSHRIPHLALIASLGLAALACGGAVLAQPQAGPQTGIQFHNTITGEVMDTSEGKPGGRDTKAVQTFFQTGKNVYIDDKSCLRNGESLFLTSCSGCHGHLAEGKVGPGLNDNYWTYPANTEDVGLFSTLWGGANGMMGPHNEDLNPDEMLQVIAWIRHLYTGPVKDAAWLSDDQKKNYKPFKEGETFAKDAPGQCKPLPE